MRKNSTAEQKEVIIIDESIKFCAFKLQYIFCVLMSVVNGNDKEFVTERNLQAYVVDIQRTMPGLVVAGGLFPAVAATADTGLNNHKAKLIHYSFSFL